MSGNHYTILGVSEGATQRDIKVAYRKLVQAHHPDVNTSGNDEMIKLINLANETLSDPVKRAQYDLTLRGSYHQPYFRPTYNTPYPNRPRRRQPPHSYYNEDQSGDTYVYSTKTKLQGFIAVTFTILIIFIGFKGMHYYASYYYFEEGQLAEANNDYTKAVNSYRLAIRDWGAKNIEATIRMIELSRMVENYNAMLSKITVGFTFHPDSAQTGQLYYLRGIGLAHTGRYQDAAISFTNSLHFAINKDSVYTQLGPIYLQQLQQYDEASKIYSYLLLDEVNNFEDHYFRAVSYQHLGKHRLALEDLLINLKEDPYNGKILFQIGRSYLALGQKEKACEYLRFAKNQGINIDPTELSRTCN